MKLPRAAGFVGIGLGAVAAAWEVLTYVPLPFPLPSPSWVFQASLLACMVSAVALFDRRTRVLAYVGISLGLLPSLIIKVVLLFQPVT